MTCIKEILLLFSVSHQKLSQIFSFINIYSKVILTYSTAQFYNSNLHVLSPLMIHTEKLHLPRNLSEKYEYWYFFAVYIQKPEFFITNNVLNDFFRKISGSSKGTIVWNGRILHSLFLHILCSLFSLIFYISFRWANLILSYFLLIKGIIRLPFSRKLP